jgi:prolyl 4-hydroxylase
MGLSVTKYIIILVCVCIILGVSIYKSISGPNAITVNGYTVLEIPHLLSDDECDALISKCEKMDMVDSEVVLKGGGNGIDHNRKSKTIWLEDNEDNVCMKMAQTANKLTDLPIKDQEKLQVVCYQPGGKFNSHYDAEYEGSVSSRVATLLVYLNHDYEGGETEFVNMGVKIKPEKGKGILFWNLDEKNEKIVSSMHQGNEVKNGEKWICTKWMHASQGKKFV